MSKIKGHENAMPIRLIFIDTKEEIEFKSVAYAKRVTGVNEYQIKESLIQQYFFPHNPYPLFFHFGYRTVTKLQRMVHIEYTIKKFCITYFLLKKTQGF